MPDTFTPNLNFTLPEIGASPDTWGNKSNANWSAIDVLFGAVGSPNSVVRNNSGGFASVFNTAYFGPAGAVRANYYYTGLPTGSPFLRWISGAAGDAEAGANAGSSWSVQRYDDTGAFLGNSIVINRATGVVVMEATPQVGANSVYHQGNLPAVIATVSEPVGTIKMYVGNTDPAGGNFMLCDGRAISRTTYAALFTVIGTQFGAGDGTTTFNIPNTAERVIVGKSTTQTLIPQFDARAMGNSFGEGRHTQITAEVGSHAHSITDPKHHHTLTASLNAPSGGGGLIGGVGAAVTSDELTGITVNASPAAAPMNVVQPSLVLQFIIRVQ
jgi:microcystin-dependent protein